MASYLKTGRISPSTTSVPAPKRIEIKPINFEVIEVDIGGLSPLIQNNGDARNLGGSFEDFRLFDHNNRDCIALDQIKQCMILGAVRGRPLGRTVVQADVFIKSPESDAFDLVPLAVVGDVEPHVVRKKIGNSSFERYFPKYPAWGATFRVEYRPERVTPDAVVNHLQDAGFSCGIGELSPSKGGQFGRFSVIAVRSAR